MRTAAALARACHPEPVAAVTALATLLAITAGRGPSGTAIVAAAVLTGQLFVGWTNDLLDAELDRHQGRPDKPLATGRLEPSTLRLAAGAAFTACIPLSLAAGVLAAAAHFAGIAAATAYNLGLKRTLFSVVPYALAFGLLPSFITLGPPLDHPPAAWATAAAALAGAAAHFAQVMPDIERDRRAGIGGLPQRLGEGLSAGAAAILLAGAAASVAIGAPAPIMLAAGVLAAGLGAGILAAGATRRLTLAFRLTVAAALVVVGALVLTGSRF